MSPLPPEVVFIYNMASVWDTVSQRAHSLLDAAQRRENLAVTASVGAVAVSVLGVAAYRFATKPYEGPVTDFQASFQQPRKITTHDGTPLTIKRVTPSKGEISAAAETLGRAMRNDPLIRECAQAVRLATQLLSDGPATKGVRCSRRTAGGKLHYSAQVKVLCL